MDASQSFENRKFDNPPKIPKEFTIVLTINNTARTTKAFFCFVQIGEISDSNNEKKKKKKKLQYNNNFPNFEQTKTNLLISKLFTLYNREYSGNFAHDQFL